MSHNNKRKIQNDVVPQKSISKINNANNLTDLYNKLNISFDISFAGCFYSINEKYFNNCLKDALDFVQQYKTCVTTLNKLSSKTLYELMSTGEFRHCHPITGKDEEKAYRIIKRLCGKVGLGEEYFEQNIGSEKIYQIGFDGALRIFGAIRGNVFRIFFIDYFHHFDYDETKNYRDLKNYKFCPMSHR